MVKPREKRVPIMMSEEEMLAIDDWRFANRVATRSEAIRRLSKLGIEMDSSLDQIRVSMTDLGNAWNALADRVEENPNIRRQPKVLFEFMLELFDLEHALTYNTAHLLDIKSALTSGNDIEDAFANLQKVMQSRVSILKEISDADADADAD